MTFMQGPAHDPDKVLRKYYVYFCLIAAVLLFLYLY